MTAVLLLFVYGGPPRVMLPCTLHGHSCLPSTHAFALLRPSLCLKSLCLNSDGLLLLEFSCQGNSFLGHMNVTHLSRNLSPRAAYKCAYSSLHISCLPVPASCAQDATINTVQYGGRLPGVLYGFSTASHASYNCSSSVPLIICLSMASFPQGLFACLHWLLPPGRSDAPFRAAPTCGGVHRSPAHGCPPHGCSGHGPHSPQRRAPRAEPCHCRPEHLQVAGSARQADRAPARQGGLLGLGRVPNQCQISVVPFCRNNPGFRISC